MRREQFRIFIGDLSNILSSNYKTTGLLGNYPVSIPVISKSYVDRSVKSLLLTLTSGQAKLFVSSSKTAVEALTDLKRNCALTTVNDQHRARRHIYEMQQLQNETALSFLICLRKQVWIAASLGCNDFNDDTIICNIALEGINSNLSLYQATIAREKDKLLLNPGTMNLASLEETFFALDNSWSSKVKTGFKKYPRNERAKAAHQQHKINAKRPQNKCPPHIKCYVCGANHWATQCPQRKNGDRSKEGSTTGS